MALQQTQRLLEVMVRLRDPQGGCPWDIRQDFRSLLPYTLEEAYEVADAIERGDFDDLRGELGDLLFQVVFQARIAEERGLFDFEAVAEAMADKLIRRHPHVFSDAVFEGEAAFKHAWEQAKLDEQPQRGSIFDGIATALPALLRAEKLQKRAARFGFDWPETERVFGKVQEELDELREAHAEGDTAHIEEEMGDLLFVVVNLARHLGVAPEAALRAANAKFTRRFQHIERSLAEQGQALQDTPLAALDALWDQAKAEERAASGQ
jgi:MazG family protein